jgi:hypothetical protein
MKTLYRVSFILEARKNKEPHQLINDNIPIYMDVPFARKRLRYSVGLRTD